MRVGVLADAVELQIGDPQTRLGGRHRELGVLRETDAVGRRLCAEIANLPRVGDRVEKMRRDRRLPARELDGQLTPGLTDSASSRICFTSGSVRSCTYPTGWRP